MKTTNELTALQNSIEYFKIDVVVKLSFEQDQRKKPKFVLTKEDRFVSPSLNYNEMNNFILGIANCKKYNL